MRFDRRSREEGEPRTRLTLRAFRYVVAAVVAVSVASPVVGAAATMGVGPDALGVGRTSIARCDTDGFTVTYTTVGGNVTAANVGGIDDPGCEGGQLQVTLTGSGATGTSSAVTVPTDGDTTTNSVDVSFSGTQPNAETVNQVHVGITGP